MAKLVYTANTSLDGYTEDSTGSFEWTAPTAEVHQYINDRERPIGTYLYGRRLYETMRYWETADAETGQSAVGLDYAQLWQAADKIVYSSTLSETSTRRTTLERIFDPAAVAAMVDSADRDVSVGGATLAANAFAAGIVDEVNLYIRPIAVGGGKPALPKDVWVEMELLEDHRFTDGVVHLRYQVKHD